MSTGPQARRMSASAARAEWNPYARRTMSLALLFSASARALLRFRRRAARMPSRCLRIVRPSLTNGPRRLREQAGQQPIDQLLDGRDVREPTARARPPCGTPCSVSIAPSSRQRHLGRQRSVRSTRAAAIANSLSELGGQPLVETISKNFFRSRSPPRAAVLEMRLGGLALAR